MAKIKAFRAFIYNQEKIKDLSKVVCPPYDIISTQKQAYFHSLSRYNLIHILLGKDIPGEDKYRRAGRYLKEWLKEKILIQDDTPAIYFYSQQYKVKGESRMRLGFIALLGLQDKQERVFAHEHTRLEPKEDRLRLLKQVKANLSPIFVIFQDSKRIIQRIEQREVQGKAPFIDLKDEEGITHKLWRLSSQDAIGDIEKSVGGENILIADGHHRYEVALSYREYMKNKLGPSGQDEAFNYILTYFTNTDPRGLTILPIHRLVLLDRALDTNKLLEALGDYFEVEEVKDKARFFFLMEKGGRYEHLLGMYKEKRYWLLRIKNIRLLDRLLTDRTKEYRILDISILNQVILKNVLKLDLEDKDNIAFSHNHEELIERVDSKTSSIAFLLNPARVQQVIGVALKGERMPSKSTYFYPKVLSGLVINKFNEGKS